MITKLKRFKTAVTKMHVSFVKRHCKHPLHYFESFAAVKVKVVKGCNLISIFGHVCSQVHKKFQFKMNTTIPLFKK